MSTEIRFVVTGLPAVEAAIDAEELESPGRPALEAATLVPASTRGTKSGAEASGAEASGAEASGAEASGAEASGAEASGAEWECPDASQPAIEAMTTKTPAESQSPMAPIEARFGRSFEVSMAMLACDFLGDGSSSMDERDARESARGRPDPAAGAGPGSLALGETAAPPDWLSISASSAFRVVIASRATVRHQAPTSDWNAGGTTWRSCSAIATAVGNRSSGLRARAFITRSSSAGGTRGAYQLGGSFAPERTLWKSSVCDSATKRRRHASVSQ